MPLKPLLGVLSVLGYLLCTALYLRAAYRTGTKPHPFSWGVWALSGAIAFFAQHVERAGPGAWQQGAAAVAAGSIMVVALLRGERSYTRSDWVALLFCLSAIPLWIATDTPLWSILLLCAIDGAGAWPTLRKAWDKPASEPALPYALWSLSALVSIAAIERYAFITVVYSAFVTVLNGAVAAVVLARGNKNARR